MVTVFLLSQAPLVILRKIHKHDDEGKMGLPQSLDQTKMSACASEVFWFKLEVAT